MEDMELTKVAADAIRRLRDADPDRALGAATELVERNGYVVLGRDLSYDDLPGKADMVIAGDGVVALVTVDMASANVGEFPKPSSDLDDMRRLAMRWCEENGNEPDEMRVDAISVQLVNSHQAFFRWNKNRRR